MPRRLRDETKSTFEGNVQETVKGRGDGGGTAGGRFLDVPASRKRPRLQDGSFFEGDASSWNYDVY